jgi:tripartite-type tricarboxylate transporter receptor subunit TctC
MQERSMAKITKLSLACSLLFTSASFAQAQEALAQVYKGKTVYVVIGSAAGGGFDTYGRLIARHIGKHIPGNPNVVPQNMPGAGGSAAATHVATVAAQDGTYIGAVHPAVIMDPVLGDRSKSKFDVTKLNWIGSANSDTYVCVLRADAKVKSFADAQSMEVILGASSDAASTRDFPTLLNNVLGTKFKLVAGYSGNREVMLAVDKNEVQGICGAGWSSVLAVRSQWFKDGTVNVLAQENIAGHPDLNKQGIPKTIDFAKTPEQKQILELYYNQETFGRPYMMGQNVPKDRVEAIRAAFIMALKDPDLLAEAKKSNLDIEMLDGAALQKIVENIFALDQSVIDKTKKALGYEK